MSTLAEYPAFTSEMKATHKILLPQMAPIHFALVSECLKADGYDIEILENDGRNVVTQGLMHVHNDACYPALLVIGQFIDALQSGRYDLDHVALAITQTGGGCRASNYIHMLRKALVKAGLPGVPVASLNFSGLDSGLKLSLKTINNAAASILFADELMCLSNQTKPYEIQCGESAALVSKWIRRVADELSEGVFYSRKKMGAVFNGIAKDFADVSLRAATKIKVGIVGEIYVKYSSLGNNSLEDFLAAEGCEVNMPGMMGFLQYCIHNSMYDVDIYGGSNLKRRGYAMLLSYLSKRQDLMIQAIEANTRFIAPHSFDDLAETASKYIGLGAKMGEGWLLTGEMVELVHAGYPNIICAQPFGCLPNHVVGKGMIAKIRDANPEANIMPIDYDPGASKVNQENRIKLMLASAERSMNAAIGKPAQNAPAQGTELVSRWQSI